MKQIFYLFLILAVVISLLSCTSEEERLLNAIQKNDLDKFSRYIERIQDKPTTFDILTYIIENHAFNFIPKILTKWDMTTELKSLQRHHLDVIENESNPEILKIVLMEGNLFKSYGMLESIELAISTEDQAMFQVILSEEEPRKSLLETLLRKFIVQNDDRSYNFLYSNFDFNTYNLVVSPDQNFYRTFGYSFFNQQFSDGDAVYNLTGIFPRFKTNENAEVLISFNDKTVKLHDIVVEYHDDNSGNDFTLSFIDWHVDTDVIIIIPVLNFQDHQIILGRSTRMTDHDQVYFPNFIVPNKISEIGTIDFNNDEISEIYIKGDFSYIVYPGGHGAVQSESKLFIEAKPDFDEIFFLPGKVESWDEDGSSTTTFEMQVDNDSNLKVIASNGRIDSYSYTNGIYPEYRSNLYTTNSINFLLNSILPKEIPSIHSNSIEMNTNDLRIVDIGNIVDYAGMHGSWLLVQDQNGTTGWIQSFYTDYFWNM